MLMKFWVRVGGEQALTRSLSTWTKSPDPTLGDGWARNVLDLACGSGEATLAIQSFLERRRQPTAQRDAAAEDSSPGAQPANVSGGVDARAEPAGAVEHLAHTQRSGYRLSAIDPFTHVAFQQRTGLPCEQLSFEDVEAGCLLDGREAYSVSR